MTNTPFTSIFQRLVGVAAAILLIAACAACTPSLYDFHERILEPLALQKADAMAEQNRIQVRRAFEEAKQHDQFPGERWFGYVYWGLDALGFAGYGMPGQGRIVEKLKEWYQRSAHRAREAELNEVLHRIDEEKATNRKVILKDLIDHSFEESALIGKIYSVCVDGFARRYRAGGGALSRLEDTPC